MKASEKKKRTATARLADRWGEEVVAPGWTGLPNALLCNLAALGLDPLDFTIIVLIAKHWWTAHGLPYPSKKRLAKEIGVDERTIERRIAGLEKAGMLKKVERKRSDGGNRSNGFDLSPLIQKVKPYAERMMDTQNMKRAIAARRLGLRPVKGGKVA